MCDAVIAVVVGLTAWYSVCGCVGYCLLLLLLCVPLGVVVGFVICLWFIVITTGGCFCSSCFRLFSWVCSGGVVSIEFGYS